MENELIPARVIEELSLLKNVEGTLKIARVIAIFFCKRNFSKLRRKIQKKIFELRMAIVQSIFKTLRSSFLQTPPFL